MCLCVYFDTRYKCKQKFNTRVEGYGRGTPESGERQRASEASHAISRCRTKGKTKRFQRLAVPSLIPFVKRMSPTGTSPGTKVPSTYSEIEAILRRENALRSAATRSKGESLQVADFHLEIKK